MHDWLDMILTCALARWRPQIGDPTVIGWVTVATYFVAAFLALRVAAGPGGRRAPPERWFWVTAGVALLALGVNKQLDLQSLLTALGRCVAQAQGWYAQRRAVQGVFVFALIGLAGAALAVAVYCLRRALPRIWLALTGMAVLTTFVVVRAVSFHHIDVLLRTSAFGVRFNWAMELGGLALVAAGCLVARSRSP